MENYDFWLENLDTQNLSERGRVITEKKNLAAQTRRERVRQSFEAAEKEKFEDEKFRDFPNQFRMNSRNLPADRLFIEMWLDKNTEEVNRKLVLLCNHLREDLKTWDEHVWAPLDAHMSYMNFYFSFGPHGTVAPNRMSKEAKDALLAYLWEMTEITNDIHFARENTWHIHGSENHDLGHKISSLLSSMIFMEEEDYKDRIYPNPGTGYKAELKSPMSPELKKTIYGDYRPGDQYRVWVEFFEEYFRERVKKGFFLERASDSYMGVTVNMLFALCDHVKDGHLKQTVKKFLDLLWIDWAMETIHGIRGGAKTRHHYSAGEFCRGEGKKNEESRHASQEQHPDAMYLMARFLLGGPGQCRGNFKRLLLSDYELPDVVWKMVFNREAMGRFTYLSRGLAEENPVFPRPAGMDYTMMADVPHRSVRVSYVTPNYVLAMLHEHPRMLYNHLAVSGRWMGLIVGDTARARVVPIALDPRDRLSYGNTRYHMDLTCRGVQHENVQIFQQSRAFDQGGPNMFPLYDDHANQKMGLFLGDEWDEKVEKDGLLFLRKGSTYVSLRIILIQMDADPLAWAKGTGKFNKQMMLDPMPYTWDNDRWIRLKSRFSPVILEVGEEKDFDGFADFMEKIRNNSPELTPTVVPREAGVVIRYKGLSDSAKELMYNAANKDDAPLIDGRPLDYEYGYTFDSPYIKCKYDSGVADVCFMDEKLHLDFNE